MLTYGYADIAFQANHILSNNGDRVVFSLWYRVIYIAHCGLQPHFSLGEGGLRGAEFCGLWFVV